MLFRLLGQSLLLLKWLRLNHLLNHLHHQENTFQLLFKDNQFNVSGDKFQLTSTLTYKKGEGHMDISKLEIKQYSVIFFGKAMYAQQPEKITFSGGFSSQDVSGKITFSKQQDQVVAEINTDNFTDLPGILARFPLSKGLITWISENISAQDFWKISTSRKPFCR